MNTLESYILESLKAPLTLNPYNVFILVKPGFVKYSTSILNMFKAEGAVIAKYGARRMTLDEARDFYSPHKDEPFYEDLCKYMSGGLSVGYLLNLPSEKPIEKTTKIKDEVRKTYGKDEMKNALHSSDSSDNVDREAKIFFKGL